jgi:hypothetical protein
MSKWCSVNQIPFFQAETQTDAGLRSVNLLDEKAIGMALIRYNPELGEMI